MTKWCIRKPLSQLQVSSDERTLKRTLGPANLVALGIGAIIGAGLFVRTAAAAGEAAGPAVILSFIIAAIACALAALCYSEFASMIPVAGSAYTYAYVTMGELVAWIIGWVLVLEYALVAATVAISWSEYLNKLLVSLDLGAIPYEWSHSPFEVSADGVAGIINVPAMVILTLLSLILMKGTRESAALNAIIVVVKVVIVLMFISIGWQFIEPANYQPLLIPADTPGHESVSRHGWGGVLGGAAIVFFAFIGFDAVSTAAQEAKNPKRDMPIGILGSLAICTVLYVLFAYVLTGVAHWQEFNTVGKEASVAYAIQTHMPGYGWLSQVITLAILAGFSSVILVVLLGQSRVFFSMSQDGLLPKIFSKLHPRYQTPYQSNLIVWLMVTAVAGLMPGGMAGDLTSIGTLFAFVMVCAGVWVLRVREPHLPRPFKTPWVPLVPLMGMVICSLMMLSLPLQTLLMGVVWVLVGLLVYAGYGRVNSLLRKQSDSSNN